jgi:hypothetical protein
MLGSYMGVTTSVEEIKTPAGISGVNRLVTSDVVVATILGILTAIYLLPLRHIMRIDADEGIILQGAIRVLQGQLPYRDFFSFYTPASYFWDALLFRVFGDTITVPRTTLMVYGSLFSASTYLLARRLASRTAAIFVTLLLMVSCVPVRFLLSHNWDSTMAALLAFCCAIALLHRPNLAFAAGIGFFSSMSVLFNQARGVGFVAGLCLGFALLKLRLGEDRINLKHFATTAGSFLVMPIVTTIYFASQGSFGHLLRALLWPHQHYSGVNLLPYGFMTMTIEDSRELFFNPSLFLSIIHYIIISPIFVICTVPILVILIGLSLAVFKRNDLPPEQLKIAVLTGAVTLGSLLSISLRPDFHHITFLAPLYFFLLPWLMNEWLKPYRSLSALAPLVIVFVMITFAAYGGMLILTSQTYPLKTRRGDVKTYGLNQAIPYIESHFPAGSKLLIHPYMPLYGFMTKTMTPLRYEYLMPGFHTREQFHEAAKEIERLKPEAVLYQMDFVSVIPSSWPNSPEEDMIFDPVIDYLAPNYRACKTLDTQPDSPAKYVVLVRKDLGCEKWQ